MARSTLAALVLLASSFPLTGCIVGEIRDSLQTANRQLTDVQTTLEKLDSTNEQLAQTNAELTRTAELIGGVQQGLGRIDATNASLGSVDQRLALLQSINTSLTHLDNHLASLRKTIGRIDSAIPFLDLGGDEPVPEEPMAQTLPPAPVDADVAGAAEPAPAPADETAPAAPPVAPATPGASPSAGPATPSADPASIPSSREPMLGTWISRYPDEQTALVILPDRRFILATALSVNTPAGAAPAALGPREVIGSWKRQDRSLLLEEDARPATTPDGKEVDVTTRHTIEVVMSAGRSITVRIDGHLVVLARP